MTVEDIAGDALIRTSYNGIVARRIGGALDIDGGSCSVRVEGVQGPLTVDNSYEYVIVEGCAASVKIGGDSSPVEIVNIAALPADAIYDIRTSYERVKIVLPADASVEVQAETTYGEIESDFPMVYTSRGGKRAELSLGAGEAKISITTSEDIVIKQGR